MNLRLWPRKGLFLYLQNNKKTPQQQGKQPAVGGSPLGTLVTIVQAKIGRESSQYEEEKKYFMLALGFQSDIQKLLNPIYQLTAKQYPFIVALALTKTAQEVQKAEIAEMSVDLDKPTPFTLRGTYVRPATKQTLEAEVDLKDFGGKGGAAHKYLQPQILGGGRGLKKFEYALRAAGVLPAGMYVVPGKGATLDQYGNVTPRSIYTQILSALGSAEYKAGYAMNRTKRSAARNKKLRSLFAVNTPGRLPLGIYERKGRSITILFAFVKAPAYRQRYSFYETAQQKALEVFPRQLQLATDRALSTAYRV